MNNNSNTIVIFIIILVIVANLILVSRFDDLVDRVVELESLLGI